MNKSLDKNDIVQISKDINGEPFKLKREDAVYHEVIYFLCSFLCIVLSFALIICIIPVIICFIKGIKYHKLSKAPAITVDECEQKTDCDSNDFLKSIETIHIENIYEFKVAGVTFNTGRKSRQAALRKIHFGDEPFENIHVWLNQYDFEGEKAIGVFVNNFQVGNIARKDINKVLDLLSDDYYVSDYSVYGGGDKNWGMVIKMSEKDLDSMEDIDLTYDEYELIMRYRFASDEIKVQINDLIDFYDGKE